MKLKQNVLYLSNTQARCLYIIILSQSISLNHRPRVFQDWDPGKRSEVTLHETSSKNAMPDLVSYEKAPEKQHPGSIFPISCKHIWRTQHFEQSVVPKNSTPPIKPPVQPGRWAGTWVIWEPASVHVHLAFKKKGVQSPETSNSVPAS